MVYLTTNDIVKISDFIHTIVYANYTCIILNGKQYNDLVKFLNLELEKLFNWLRSNKLSLNVRKTYYMVFHRSRIKIDDHFVITMNKDCLQITNIVKYLRVIIDHKLNWTQHIAHVKTRISKGMA